MYKVVHSPKHDEKYQWLVVNCSTGKWVDDFHKEVDAINRMNELNVTR